MALNLGTIIAAVKLETREFNNELDDITRRFDRFLEVGVKVAEGITRAFASWLEVGIETQSMLDQNTRAFENLAGSADKAQEFMDRLRQFAVATPFEFEGIANSVKTLQAMGIQLDNTIPLLQVFGDKAASAGKGADNVKLMANAFSQVMASGKLMGQELNQFVNNGVAMIPILSKAYGKSAGEIRTMMEAGMLDAKTVLTAVLKDMVATSEGQMSAMNQTFSGRMNSIKEAFRFASADALKPLYDQIVEIMPIVAAFGLALLSIATEFVPYIQMAVNIIANLMLGFVALDESTQKWVVGITLATAAAFVLATAVATIIFTVAAAVAAIVTFFMFVSTTALGAIAIVAGLATTFIAFAARMIATATLIFGAWNAQWFQPIKKELIAFKTLVVGAAQFCADQWITIFKGLYKQAVFIFDGIFDAIMKTVEGFAKSVQKIAGAIFRNVPGPAWWKEDILNAIGAMDELQIATRNWREGDLPSMIQGTVGDIATKLPGMLSDGMNMLGEHYSNALSKLLPDDVRNSGQGLLDKFNSMTELAPVDLDKLLEDLFGNFKVTPPKGQGDWAKKLIGGDVLAEWDKLKKEIDNIDVNSWFEVLQTKLEAIDISAMKTAVDQVTDAFEPLMEEMKKVMTGFEDLTGRLTSSMGIDKLISAGKSGKDAFGPMMGGMLEGIGGSGAAAGMLAGPLGALIGIIIEIATGTQSMADIVAFLDEVVQMVTKALDGLLQFIRPLLSVLMSIVSGPIAALSDIFVVIGDALSPLAAALVPLGPLLQTLSAAVSSFFGALSIIQPILQAAFFGIYYILNSIALIVMSVVYGLGVVWNGIINVLVGVLELLSKVPGVGKLLDEAIKSLEDSKINLQAIEDDIVKAANTSFEEATAQANAQAEATAAVEDTTAAMHQMTAEMINVPEGYKVALARFQSMDPSATRLGSAVVPLARGGIVTKPTFALVGEAGPEAVIPLSKMAGGNASTIHINHVTIVTDNIEDMAEQITRIADRQAFLGMGTPMATPKYKGR